MKEILDRYRIEQEHLLYVEVKPVSVFVNNEVTEGYVDNLRCDIITKKVDVPFIHEGKEIVGYTFYDKYLYGREKQTSKKFALTLYYAENEVIE